MENSLSKTDTELGGITSISDITREIYRCGVKSKVSEI